MKILSPLLILLISFLPGYASPQKQPRIFSVSYQNAVNGKTRADDAGIRVLCSAESSKSWVAKDSAKLLPEVASETSYIDYVQKKTYQVARFANGTMINYQLPFSDYPVLAETNETAVILGYHCKKVITSLRSNSIEIWYTTEPGVKGTPAVSSGVPDGLVLKVVRNGNFTITATEIKALKQKNIPSILPEQMGETLGLPLYKHRITESLVTTINVFSNEQVSYGNKIANPDDPESTKTFKYSSGTILLKKINLPVFDDDTQLFAEVYQHSEGDAYDRTGSVFIVPMDKQRSFLDGLKHGIKELPTFLARNGKTYQGVVATQTFSPLIELMRFFTPFGIGAFNDKSKVYGQHWEDSTYYKQDITDLLPLMQGERLIGIFIGNYDKGGHRVTLNLKYYPGSREKTNKPVKKHWSLPLFNTLNVMEMSGQEYGTMFDNDSLSAEVTIPPGIKNLQLRYITTGHGGWGGGDEFNLKINTILIDQQVLFQFGPWRCDCATFRKYNPASGNFWNGTSSSDYSRSGWCPGTATNPVYFPIAHLSPGKHKFSVAIPLGKSEGGSFSSWNVSAILLGEYE